MRFFAGMLRKMQSMMGIFFRVFRNIYFFRPIVEALYIELKSFKKTHDRFMFLRHMMPSDFQRMMPKLLKQTGNISSFYKGKHQIQNLDTSVQNV